MLETIFNHQRELMNKYHDIEEGLVGHPVPSTPNVYGPHCGSLNLDDRASQLQIKSFAWRVTEEITEATLAEGGEIHTLEELADALHFAVELLIMSGLAEKDLVPSGSIDKLEFAFNVSQGQFLELREAAYNCIEALGEGMNRLKLKPWKATPMITDKAAYRDSMLKFFLYLIDLMKSAGFTARSLCGMYLNKNAVNQFRIRSKY